MSIVGSGTALDPLTFMNDVEDPGEWYAYITNALGVKGWNAMPEVIVELWVNGYLIKHDWSKSLTVDENLDSDDGFDVGSTVCDINEDFWKCKDATVGAAVWDRISSNAGTRDLNFFVSSAKVPAVNAPTWATLVGNRKGYTFDVDDYVDLQDDELPHEWIAESDVTWHLHIYTNGLDDTDRTFKVYLEWFFANSGSAVGTDSHSIQFTIPANTPDRTHLMYNIKTVTMTGKNYGAAISVMIKRVTADSGTPPTNDPFFSKVGLHYRADKFGSS